MLTKYLVARSVCFTHNTMNSLLSSVFIARKPFAGKAAISLAECGGIYLSMLFAQGVGGSFTHFYSGTLHAIDFECPEGTPVLAMASGTVKEVRQSITAGGVHARGLFEWNSVSVWYVLVLYSF